MLYHGKELILFPQNVNVAEGKIEGNKINCCPRDQSLSDLLYSWKFTKPSCDGSHWSTFAGNSVLLPSDFIDFAMLPTPRFWQETVSLLDFM